LSKLIVNFVDFKTLALRALLTEDPDDTKEAIKRLEAAEKLLSKTQKSSGILVSKVNWRKINSDTEM
jgi:hypothetical protein